MKKLLLYFLLLCKVLPCFSQYYLRGNVTNEKGAPLAQAYIYLHSSKMAFRSGFDGAFGIKTSSEKDTITISLDGYIPKIIFVKTSDLQKIVLQMTKEAILKNTPRLFSEVKNSKSNQHYGSTFSSETYFKLIENDFVETQKFPSSGFSLNVNKASYSNVRRFINGGIQVPPDAVKVEEFINYFNLYNEPPDANEIFKIKTNIAECPWNNKHHLIYVKINARKLSLEKIPPGNFVFLIDVSGSMDLPNRLPLIKEAFQLFVNNLRAIDKVSIVTYGGSVGTWLEPTTGDQKDSINKKLDLLFAGGDTPGQYGLEAAYKMAKSNFIEGGNNRVIIATDADFNVGETSEKELEKLVSKERESGVFLTCLGVGSGNFKDSKLQTLAKAGNGNYAYLDNLKEAEKVLVKELTQTLYAVADNAFINVEFNPTFVKNYRLIGFDNKREALQDGSSFLDGGEIGSGSSTIAIFEIEPENTLKDSYENLGKVQINYRETISKKRTNQTKEYTIPHDALDTSDINLKFATALTFFGLKLKESPFINNANWNDVKNFAEKNLDKNISNQAQFIDLLNKAINVYEPTKKKKKRKKKETETN